MDDLMDDLIAEVVSDMHSSISRGVLSMWTIYHRPRDWPGSYVARRFEVGKDGPVPTKSEMKGEAVPFVLETMRLVFRSAGLTCMTRSESDEPPIVETWL
jgi:hypothetical protein